MTAKELRDALNDMFQSNPDMLEARVVVDTEARRFNAHLIGADGVYDMSNEESGTGDIVYLTLDTRGSEL